MTTGTLETIDGRPALRFERRLPHSVERVWRAVSDPNEMSRWFVATVEWTPEVGRSASRRPGLLDQRRRDAAHRPWARFHWHASCSSVRPWRSAIGRISLEPLAAALDPARGPEAAVVAARELVAGQHVVVEQAAVVDDARDHLHAVALGRRQHQLAGPRLERVEDHHRPVDPVAEALEAVDHVEREAVGGARARRRACAVSPSARTASSASHTRLARVAGAVGVVQEQEVERVAPQRSRLRSVAIRT